MCRCWSNVGLQVDTGPQHVSIGTGCEDVGTALHELGHAIGWYHEHSREDRDQYIDVMWKNVDSTQKEQFEKYPHGQADDYGISYDLHSVMHFSAYAFSVNGYTTIKAKDGSPDIGNGGSLTDRDAALANQMYHCKSHKNCTDMPENLYL